MVSGVNYYLCKQNYNYMHFKIRGLFIIVYNCLIHFVQIDLLYKAFLSVMLVFKEVVCSACVH